MEVLGWLIAGLLVAAGVAGIVLPALPGAPLVFSGVLVAAWLDDFERIGGWSLAVVGLIALLTVAVDYAATVLGGRRFGGSRWGAAGALVGVVVGMFFGLPGLLLGPPVGAFAFETAFARKSMKAALRSGVGSFVGFVLGTAAKCGLIVAMLGVGAAAYFF